MRKFTPLGDRVLILPDTAPVKSTGLAAPPSQKDVPTEGTVIAAGPKSLKFYQHPAECVNQVINPGGVAIGQRVQFAKYAGRDVKHNGVMHKLVRLEEIEGIIEEVDE